MTTTSSAAGAARANPSIGSSAWYPLRTLYREVTQAVAAHDLNRAGDTVVDFGAEDVPYAHIFDRAEQYLAADIGDGAPIRINDDGTLPLDDDSADVVTSFQVLEHVPDVALYLREAYRVLKPGGAMLLSTHGVWPVHPHPTDFWRWTPDGLRKIVGEAGFELAHFTGMIGPLGWTDQIRMAAVRRLLASTRVLTPVAWVVAAIYNVKIFVFDKITPDQFVQRDPAIVLVVGRKPA